MMMKRKA
jgi:hypothetical protein